MSSSVRQQAEARVGTLLDGKWKLDTFLGYGGSAAVYGATHRNGKRVAVKVLHAHCAADPDLVARFLREGYLANKIAHPGVVSVQDDDRAPDGTTYLVMELLQGRSFERHGRGAAPPLSIPEALQVADDLLDVLAAAHELGLVHRDIKPANIFLTTDGHLKVLDFGIARLAESTQEINTQTGMLMGTPAFMPPEQARGRWNEVDARSDIWSVGVTLSALLTGKRPRTADTPAEELLAAMMQPMTSLRTLLPDAPNDVVELLDKAYAFERENRWQSAREMQTAARALRHRLENAPIGSPLPSVTMRFSPEMHPAPSLDPTPPPTGQRGQFFGSTLMTPPPVQTIPSSPPEPPPSLTTNRASVSARTAPPPPSLPAPAARKGGAVIAIAAVVAIACLVGGTALFMKNRAHVEPPAAAPAAPPPPPPAPSPLPSPTETATAAPTPSAAPAEEATDASVAPKRPVRPHPANPKSDPNKFFEQRTE